MKLPDFAIRRPVFITMQVLAVLVLGIVSYNRLGVDLMPDVDFPFVIATVVWPGASAREVETEITDPLEDKLSAISGLKNLYSYSYEGYGLAVLEFELEADPREAEADVRTEVEKALPNLPLDIEKPVVARVDGGAEPVISFAVGGRATLEELRRIADDEIKPQIEKIAGVAEVDVAGGLEREVKVELEPAAFAGYGISLDEVTGALAAANLDVPAGPLQAGPREEKLRVAGKFRSREDIENVVVARKEGSPIYLRDVATVDVDSYKEIKTIPKLNGKDAVTVRVGKASGANTVAVCDETIKRLEKIKKTLPEGVTVDIAYNDADFIKESISDTGEALYLGAIFAVLVILIFLGNIRTTVISALAIPTSILFTFIMMYAAGFTLNMLTLMALALAVGILIDDAIVVRENIYRHWEAGMSLEKSASFGTAEVGLAVMATTFTICAVFVPVAYMGDIVGRFFRQFGLVVVFAVMYSLWDALTMAPMLSAKLLIGSPDPTKKNRFERLFSPLNRQFERLADGYRAFLRRALERRVITLVVAVVAFVGSLFLIRYISTGFMPAWDQGYVYAYVNTPLDSSLEFTESVADDVEKLVASHEAVETTFATVGVDEVPNHATITAKLKPIGEREASNFEMQEEFRRAFADYSRAEVTFHVPGMGGGGTFGQQPVSVDLSGPDLGVLEGRAEKFVAYLKTLGASRDAGMSYEKGRPETRLVPDRAMCTEMGIPVATVAMTVRGMVEGAVATKYTEGDEDYDVRVMIPRREIRDLADVEGIYLKNFDDDVVPLAMLVDVERDVGPTEIQHTNRQRTVTVWTGKALGAADSDLQREMGAYVEKNPLPPGYEYSVGRTTEMQQTMFVNMFTALAIAVVFIYIVLAAQFNSFTHPFTIMLALPLAAVGAIIAIFILGTTFDTMTMVGIILLMGLVNKNTILLVDYSLQQIDKGKSITEALLAAGPVRMRPILMTTAAMIMGMFPTALGLGEGGAFRQGMAVAVIGGLLTSTFLTLVVVPVVFSIVEGWRHRRRRPAGNDVVQTEFE
ncbi:MAG TPA: efflux RND transporter permease subunit [bacterium]|nr:efflux RND transporter permease subunit [bacterium]